MSSPNPTFSPLKASRKMLVKSSTSPAPDPNLANLAPHLLLKVVSYLPNASCSSLRLSSSCTSQPAKVTQSVKLFGSLTRADQVGQRRIVDSIAGFLPLTPTLKKNRNLFLILALDLLYRRSALETHLVSEGLAKDEALWHQARSRRASRCTGGGNDLEAYQEDLLIASHYILAFIAPPPPPHNNSPSPLSGGRTFSPSGLRRASSSFGSSDGKRLSI